MAKRYRSHELDIYGAHLHICTDQDQWASLCRKVDSLDDDPGGLGFTSLDLFESEGCVIPHLSVFVDVAAHGDNITGLIETCAHEATHVVGLLFKHIGEQIHGNSETHAYAVGWVTRWLFEAVAEVHPGCLTAGS